MTCDAADHRADAGELQALQDWMTGTALPFWLDAGCDRAIGRFHERLAFDGSPLAVPQRAMVQARQIFVFAESARRGWIDPGEAPARAMQVLLRDHCERSAGCASVAFSVHADGRIASAVRDAYTHAFLLLACASLYGLTGEPALLATAGEITAYIDRHLVDRDHGGLFDSLPDPPALKRQNPVMHLLEAYLALAEVHPAGSYMDRAADLMALFRRQLVRHDQSAVIEYFAVDWSPHPDPDLGRHFEPGHHFEWVWLLDAYARASGEDLSPGAALFEIARRIGLSSSGAVFDQVDPQSRKPAGAHRLWPHTEAVRAALVRAGQGDPTAAALAADMAGILNHRFLRRPFPAGWLDRLDAAGAALVDHVPASSLYHLATAAFEIERATAGADRNEHRRP